MSSTAEPHPLALKPDLAEAARHWDAFYASEIIDRPVVCVNAWRGDARPPGASYRQRVLGDMDRSIDMELARAEAIYWGGESVPAWMPSFGPDEVAVFCGAELKWADESGDTNWSVPFVKDWDQALPLCIQEDNPFYQRILALYRRAADRMAGKMLLSMLDLHTNMDLLLAVRTGQRLCLDCIDRPETVDRAMESARAVFPVVWDAVARAGRMDELGYCHGYYSMEGAATLQCDFSCMISPPMFRRWVLPALEEEAAIARHVVYHWDGPGALVHMDDLCASKGLHSLSYVPGAGHGSHLQNIEVLKAVQARGKAVQAWGSPEEVKVMHRQLKPELVFYCTWAKSPSDADELLDWLTRHT
jgi:hypothetical protein